MMKCCSRVPETLGGAFLEVKLSFANGSLVLKVVGDVGVRQQQELRHLVHFKVRKAFRMSSLRFGDLK